MRKILSILITILGCISMTASADFTTAFWQKLNFLSDYPNTTGLIALWQMDENNPINGATVHDYTGNHNGTLTGKATTMSMTGMKFRAINFAGGNYYVTIPTSSAFNKTSTSTMTFMGWFNPSQANNTGCWFALNSAGNAPWGPTAGDATRANDVAFWDGTQYISSGSAKTFTNGTWYHLAYVLNGGSVQLYYNGVQVGSGSANTGAITSNGAYLGYDPSDVVYTKARLDEVSLWNRAMSASEIQTIYNNQAYANSNAISISNLTASSITSSGFTSTVSFAGDLNNNSAATLYYCDATTTPGCVPTSGSSTSMSKSGNLYTATVSGLAYSPGDSVNIQVTVTDADGVNGSPITGTLRLTPNTPTLIYRSVASGATSAIATGSGANTMTISGSTATFSAALANNIGVGDAIQYDPADSATPSTIVFISGRTSSTSFTVLTAAGAAPTAGSSLQNWSLFRAYTTLSNALAGTGNTGINAGVRSFDSGPKNLVTANQRWMIALYGNGTNADSALTTVSGWTTDVDRYVQIYSPTLASEVGSSQRAAGVWDTSKYHLSMSDANSSPCNILCINNSNVRVYGIQVENTAASNQSDTVDWGASATGTQYFAYSITRFTNVTASINNYCISLQGLAANGTVYAYNNIAYGCGTGIGFSSANASTTFNIYNNTIYGASGSGIRYDTSVATVKLNMLNNIAYNNGTDLYSSLFSGTMNSAYNLTKDTTGSQVTLTFANTAGKNYLLASTDTVAMGTGTDLGHPLIQSSFSFNDDILGGSRTAGQWDIGAHQY